MSSESEKLLTEASIWLVRLERGLQPQEGAQLRGWLTVPAQRDAIVDLAKVHHGPDIVAVLADLVPVGFGSPTPPTPKRWRPAKVIIGTCMALLALSPLIPIFLTHGRLRAVASANWPLDPILPWGQQTFTTKFAETSKVTLADGTRLTLNGHTQILVDFGVGFRQATIRYGEAMLDIGPKRERPFEIVAGGRHFQAPTSKFDVRVIGSQAVELTVLEGAVTVQGLPWHWPDTPAEARIWDPHVYSDSLVGPMQAAVLQDGVVMRYPVTAANVRTLKY